MNTTKKNLTVKRLRLTAIDDSSKQTKAQAPDIATNSLPLPPSPSSSPPAPPPTPPPPPPPQKVILNSRQMPVSQKVIYAGLFGAALYLGYRLIERPKSSVTLNKAGVKHKRSQKSPSTSAFLKQVTPVTRTPTTPVMP